MQVEQEGPQVVCPEKRRHSYKEAQKHQKMTKAGLLKIAREKQSPILPFMNHSRHIKQTEIIEGNVLFIAYVFHNMVA